MESINEQLNIRIPRNPNSVSQYARARDVYQVQLGTADPDLDFYNDTQGMAMSNADGWDSIEGDRDLGAEAEAAAHEAEGYAEFLGSYPICVNSRCKECKNDCKNVQGLKWTKGGKECHKGCVAQAKSDQMDRINALTTADAVKAAEVVDAAPEKAGIGAGAMIGMAVGGLLIVGLVGYLVLKKK